MQRRGPSFQHLRYKNGPYCITRPSPVNGVTSSARQSHKKTFGTADMVNRCVIFNICGGKYRLVVRVNFVGQRMWIKYLLPHNEYEKLDLKEDSKCRP